MPGVVHEHVDAAELVGACARTPRAVEVGEVDRPRARSGACSRQPREHLVEPVGAPRADADGRAACREALGERGADARRRAGDEHVLALQVVASSTGDASAPLAAMPLTPESVLLDRPRRDRHRRRAGHRCGDRDAFARFGADVAVCDRDADGSARTAEDDRSRRPSTSHTELLDVRDGDAVRDVDRRARRGRRAGEQRRRRLRRPFLDVNDKGQDALIRENFTSVTHFVRACVPQMPERGGSIVNITSIEAHRAAPGFAVYSAMKAGGVSLTKSLALELGDRRSG